MAATRHAMARVETGRRWLALALAVFALLSAGLFVVVTLADRAATLELGRANAANTATLLAEHADRALRVADITAVRVAELIRRHGPEALADEHWPELAALDSSTPETGALRVFDAEGRLVATSEQRGPPEPVMMGERGWFLSLRAGTPREVSGLARSRSGAWYFGWNHAVRQDGRFLGVVQAEMQGEGFLRLDRLAPAPGAELRLTRADGLPLMTWPLPEGEVERAAPRPMRFGPEGLAEEVGRDGISRLVAWRATRGAPVVAIVVLPRDEVLAPFHQRLLRNGLLFAVSLLLAGALAAAAIRAERRSAAARRHAEEREQDLAQALAERSRLAASLQEGEARLRLAEQAGGIGLWDLNLEDARILLAGEVFALWGLPLVERRAFRPVPVRAVLRSIHHEDRGPLVAAVAAALRGGRPLAAEFRLARRGAPETWIGVRAEPMALEAGQPRRLLGIALDATVARSAERTLRDTKEMLERRVAERTGALAEANARLREGEARFRGLFNATFQFIGLLSPDGTVLEANAAMLRMGDVRLADVVGRPYWTAPWWPGDEATRALVREAVTEGAAGRFVRRETAMRDAEGRHVAVDFSVTPVRDEDGIVSLLVAEARDVSALKAAQALLHEAQKMDTLGQLTGGVAHDFNNLLMAVLGNLAILRKRVEGRAPEALRHIDAATQAAERGATLTQRLLAFARRQDLKPMPVDLRKLVLGVEALLRRSAGPLVQLEIAAPEGLPYAHVDPHALELALVNLAVNARDAMPDGGRLSVRLELVEEGSPGRLATGRWLTLAVQDNGLGMDAETLSRAVEPFFTTKAPGQGTGLGLSMVHGLAAQSGGALVLESEPGEGTTATLWLPVSPLRPPALLEAPEEPSPQPGRGAVLVVDDEPLVLESTVAMLEELGYDPMPASSGQEALVVLEGRPDLVAVLTDHAMPGMTGMALVGRIRTIRPGLPVILATGHAGPFTEESESVPRLAKPYTLAQLSGALQGALSRPTPE